MDKVTRDDLRSMKNDELRTFDLPDAKACDSAKSLAYQLQNHLKCKFKVSTDYKKNRITILRKEL